MLRRAIILLALLGQFLPPVVCARRCCWMPARTAEPATPIADGCPCCPADEPEDQDTPAPRRDGPHAPCCPANPERHLVAWSHARVSVDADLGAPCADLAEAIAPPAQADPLPGYPGLSLDRALARGPMVLRC